MTKAQFYKLVKKPDQECDAVEIHLKRCWENNRAKSIFTITGLDFSDMLKGEEIPFMDIINPIGRVTYSKMGTTLVREYKLR